jgi:uncharacterized protein (TIGR03790 family)
MCKKNLGAGDFFEAFRSFRLAEADCLRNRHRAVLAVALLLALPCAAAGQGPDNVLIVVNGAIPDSIQIGEHYQRTRRIPTDHMVRINIPNGPEQIPRAAYEGLIEAPIRNWIARQQAHDRLLFIVLVKGVPLRIEGSTGRTGTVSSVDSELTLLYRRMTGQPIAPTGHVVNPYFQAARPIAEARPFTHEVHDIYLVTRLDGFTVADVIALIDRGSKPSREGRFVLDQRASILPEPGNQWLQRAADVLGGLGLADRLLLETTGQVAKNQSNVLGYYSWGSNDPAMTDRRNNFTFEPGALAATYVSTDGRTFREPAATWTHGRWEEPKTFHGGSPQSLTGDLIRQGVTGVAGHVAEPFLDATIRPDVLFPAYVSGFTLAESFYLAMPFLSWQSIVIGDPLTAPFRRQAVDAAELSPPVDPSTELPAFFSARALKVRVRTQGDTAPLLMRAESRVARQDFEGAIAALIEATARNPKQVDGQLLLAALYERQGDQALALERYRAVIAAAPGNVTALNNLAFALAEQRDTTGEAVALARRAASLAPQNPQVLDTLAWALHQSGDSAGARAPIALALRAAPNSVDMLLHSALIDMGAGELVSARTKLERALTLAPAIESREDVRALREKLAAVKVPERPSTAKPGNAGPSTAKPAK